MSFATRMWARRLVNTASTTVNSRASLLRSRAMPLKAFKPIRTMATAAQQQDTAEYIKTTITEDKDFGSECHNRTMEEEVANIHFVRC